MADNVVNVEVHSLTPSAIIELFVLEVTGKEPIRFHTGTNGLRQAVTWGDPDDDPPQYSYFPIEMTGFEVSGQGMLPTPTVRIANATGILSSIVLENDDLVGAKLTRIRTLQKFLNAVNFPGGVNPDADHTAELPQEIFFVEQKTNEDPMVIEFKLVSALDLQMVKFPGRQITANLCQWTYRDTNCGFILSPAQQASHEWNAVTVYNAEGSSTETFICYYSGRAYRALRDNVNKRPDLNPDVWRGDFCRYTLQECKNHFGQQGPLPIGTFPGASKIPLF